MILTTDTRATQFYFQVHCLASVTWLKNCRYGVQLYTIIKNKVPYYITIPITVHFSTQTVSQKESRSFRRILILLYYKRDRCKLHFAQMKLQHIVTLFLGVNAIKTGKYTNKGRKAKGTCVFHQSYIHINILFTSME